MEQTVETPSVGELYRTGLIASFLAYLGIFILFAGVMMFDSGTLESAIGVLLVGGLYGLIPAAFISFLITAPLGCIVAAILSRWMEPSQWLGAVTGGAIAAGILGLWALATIRSVVMLMDIEPILFAVATIGLCAASGWFAQLKFLDWPRAFTVSDVEVFE
ncbi:MAG: hypothetical protein AAF559_03425 [Pseudomonadota bacterium]